MLKLRRLCCTSRGIEIPLCENAVDYLQENAITKQPAVLVISSSPFLKNIAQIASHSFLAESALFHQFLFFLPYLSLHALKPIAEYQGLMWPFKRVLGHIMLLLVCSLRAMGDKKGCVDKRLQCLS